MRSLTSLNRQKTRLIISQYYLQNRFLPSKDARQKRLYASLCTLLFADDQVVVTMWREWKRIEPVSYTHLDVYKRQSILFTVPALFEKQSNQNFKNS